MVSKNLMKIAGLKCISIPDETYAIWYEQIKSDLHARRIFDIQKGFDHLLSEKSYGGLDYAVFFEGAKVNQKQNAENAWLEVLNSAKKGGRLQISARAAKVLNSMGGMNWLREADPEQTNWQRKEFIEIYENTDEPVEEHFVCPGLTGGIYFENKIDPLLLLD